MDASANPTDFQNSAAVRILGQNGCSQLLEHFEKRWEQFSGPIGSYLQEYKEIWRNSRGGEMWVAPASERKKKSWVCLDWSV